MIPELRSLKKHAYDVLSSTSRLMPHEERPWQYKPHKPWPPESIRSHQHDGLNRVKK